MKKEDLILKKALEYRKRGWSIIPVNLVKKISMKKGKIEYDKKPPIPTWKEYQNKLPTREEIKHWRKKYPKAGIAVITGQLSDLAILDIDDEQGEEYTKEKGIPLTPSVKTYRGRHIYFKYPGFEIRGFVGKHNLDLRADGNYAVLPPTEDPRGGSYEWEISPEEAALAEMPEWLLDLAKEKKKGKKLKETELTTLLKGVKQGKRHATATRLAGYFLGKKLDPAVVLIQLIDWNKKNKPPLPESELQRIITDFTKKEPELEEVDEKKIHHKHLTLIPGLIHLIRDGGRVKYLMKNEGGHLFIKKNLIIDHYKQNDEIKERIIYTPQQNLPVGITSPEVLDLQGKVDFGDLLNEVMDFISQRLEMPKESDYLLLGLWTCHTYIIEKFDKTPILYFYGPYETGKGRAAEILQKIAYKCIELTSLSKASIYRQTHYFHPILTLDEVKLQGWGVDEDLRALIYNRYKKGATVPRVNLEKQGEDQIEWFEVFGPTILTTTQSIDPTLKSRAFEFIMTENLNPIVERPLDLIKAQELRNKLTVFRAKFLELDLPPWEQVARRRLNEILLPLYQTLMFIKPAWQREFKEIVKSLKKKKGLEKKLSLEADIIQIIIDKLDGRIGDLKILTQDISKVLNQDVKENQKGVTDKTIAFICSRLGFDRWKDKESRRRGFEIKRTLIKRQADKYEIDYLKNEANPASGT